MYLAQNIISLHFKVNFDNTKVELSVFFVLSKINSTEFCWECWENQVWENIIWSVSTDSRQVVIWFQYGNYVWTHLICCFQFYNYIHLWETRDFESNIFVSWTYYRKCPEASGFPKSKSCSSFESVCLADLRNNKVSSCGRLYW